MKFYKVTTGIEDEKPTYECTKTDAHTIAKAALSHLRDDVRIEHVEIDIDQAVVAKILSGWGCTETVLATWGLTPRGGLRAVPNGE